MATVLVTGAGGALGRHVVELLRARGDEVVGWTSADVDITDTRAVEEAVADTRPEVVFHLAGTRAPESMHAVNASGFRNLVGALGAFEGRIVVAGSSAQYGLRDTPRPLDEDEPQAPAGAYGETKAEQERAAMESGLDVVCARLFNLVGSGQRPGVLAADVTQQLRDPAAETVLVRHLLGTRDFVDHADAARALLTLAERGSSRSAYNVATGTATSLRTLVETLIELSGRSLPLDDRNELPTDAVRVHQAGDPARLMALGWQPQVGLPESLAAQLAG